jgi:HAD superfamily hydrolase (TIGR01509 family)
VRQPSKKGSQSLIQRSHSLCCDPALLPKVHCRFDPLLFSYQFGALKPSVALFTVVLAQLGLPAQDILLIDDASQNVEGARAVGMQACLFTSVETAY